MKAFAVWHPDYGGVVYVHAETRSKARYKVWLTVSDYVSWGMWKLNSKHIKELDDKPINPDTLLGIATEEDRYYRGCKCEICKPRS
jgi:hypothetical protein